MSTNDPQRYEPQTARSRGERAGGPPRERGTVRTWVAVVIALATLVIGGVLGYVAAGGPDQPTQLQVVTDIPAVTVTTQ